MMDVDLILVRNIFALALIAYIVYYDAKSRLKRVKRAKNVVIKKHELVYYLVVTLPYLYICSSIFKILQCFTSAIVWLKRDTDFVKCLGGQNLVYIKDFNSRHELPTLVLLKFDGTSQEFYETMRLHIYNVLYHKLDQNQSICAEVTTFRGFHYIRRDKVIHINKYVQEFVVKVREVIVETLTKRQLLGHIAIKYNAPFNINKHPLWNVFIGKQAVKWNDNDDTLYYPVLFKFSHCLFDRESFMKLILGTFADIKDLNLVFPNIEKTKHNSTNYFTAPFVMVFNCIYYLCQTAFHMYVSIPMLLVNYHLLKRKKNALSIRQRNQSLYLYTIDMDPYFLQRVGVIKLSFPNATEFSILEAVIAASLTQYCRRNEGKKNPVNIVCMSVENAECLNVTKQGPESLKFEDATYKSNTGFNLLNIYTRRDRDIKVQDILNQNDVQKNISSGRTEVEITRSLFNGNYYYYANLLKIAMNSDKCISALINNCPGPTLPIKMNGMSVEHIISWSPHLLNTGMAFNVCSYRGTYQLTININRSLLDNVDQADGLLHYIKEFLNRLSVG